jgi:hypothetical protein
MSKQNQSPMMQAALHSLEIVKRIKEQRGIELLPPVASLAFGGVEVESEPERELDWRLEITSAMQGIQGQVRCTYTTARAKYSLAQSIGERTTLWHNFTAESLEKLDDSILAAVDWIQETLRKLEYA